MIYTSYFSNIRRISRIDKDIVFVSIAGKCPDWYQGIQFKTLAPKYDWWKKWHEMFIDDYESPDSQTYYSMKYAETVLEKLDPKDVERQLYELSNGKDVCLLCYEVPEKFCHRKLVAEWLSYNGIECSEWSFVKQSERKAEQEAIYDNRPVDTEFQAQGRDCSQGQAR